MVVATSTMRLKVIGLPVLSDSSRANSSARPRRISAARSRILPRSRGAIVLHGPSSKARRAAAIARSVSAGPAWATAVMTAPVDGSRISRWSAAESIQAPLMNSSPDGGFISVLIADNGFSSSCEATRESGVVAVDRLGEAGRFRCALDFDGEGELHLHAVSGDRLDRVHGPEQPDLRADPHRAREAHSIEAVVEAHRGAGDLKQLVEQRDDQRQGQIAVRDGAAERTGRGALGIDVYPLVVVGSVGEGVHPVLRDLKPIGVAEVGAGQGAKLVESVCGAGHGVGPSWGSSEPGCGGSSWGGGGD